MEREEEPLKVLTLCVVTHQNSRGLERFLGTLLKYSGFTGNLLVWDNNEEEKERQGVKNLLCRFGFGGGYRGCGVNLFGERAIQEGSNPFQNLLDEVTSPFVAFFQDDMAFVPGEDLFWDRLIESAWFRDVGLVAPCSNELYEGQQLHRVDLPRRFVANHVHGSAVLGRTEVLREVGGWDEQLWYAIDTDLCLRLRKAGYLLVVDRRVYIHHDPATTMKKVESDLDGKILTWGELGRNLVVRKYGVEDYYNFVLSGGHDVNSACVVHGWSWDSFSGELERRVPEWIPSTP